MDEKQKLAFRARWLESGRPKNATGDPPPLIRWMNSLDEAGKAQAQCINDAGFPGTTSDTLGTIHFSESLTADQSPAAALADYRCAAQYTPDPRFLQEWTPAMVGVLYDYYVEAYVPCVEARGYTVGADRPTREAMVSGFAEGKNRWFASTSPRRQARDKNDEALKQLDAACPALPPSDVFYG